MSKNSPKPEEGEVLATATLVADVEAPTIQAPRPLMYITQAPFETKDDLGTTAYKPGDEFTPGRRWVELSRNPGDNSEATTFSVPYRKDTDTKEPVIDYRTVILPVKKV